MANQAGKKIMAFPWYAWVGAWVAIGAGIGVAIDNIALGVGLGIIIGAGIAFTFYMLNKREPKQ